MEHGTFTPLVLSSSGGWGPSAMVAYKRLASLIAEKHGHPYSSTISWIRCRIAFSLIDSAVACLRALRSSYHALPRRLIRPINCWTSFTLRSSRLNKLSYQLLQTVLAILICIVSYPCLYTRFFPFLKAVRMCALLCLFIIDIKYKMYSLRVVL